MRRFRFSIASLGGAVLAAAIAAAAVSSATDSWDSGVFGTTLLVLLTAVLLAAHRSGRRGAYWLGFAVFGWAYLAASLVPPIASRLPTTALFLRAGSQQPVAIPQTAHVVISAQSGGSLKRSSQQPVVILQTAHGAGVADFDNDGDIDLFLANTSIQGNLWALWRRWALTGGTAENFVRIMHSLAALLIGLAGGQLSRWLYSTEHPGVA